MTGSRRHHRRLTASSIRTETRRNTSNGARRPAQTEIARLAHQIWEERGCPDNNHEQDWFEAERRLTEESETPQDLRIMKQQQGSVQS